MIKLLIVKTKNCFGYGRLISCFASCKIVLLKLWRYSHMDLPFGDNCLPSGFTFNAGAGDSLRFLTHCPEWEMIGFASYTQYCLLFCYIHFQIFCQKCVYFILIFIYLFGSLGLRCRMWDLFSCGMRDWERGVLTTGPPGKSPQYCLLMFTC